MLQLRSMSTTYDERMGDLSINLQISSTQWSHLVFKLHIITLWKNFMLSVTKFRTSIRRSRRKPRGILPTRAVDLKSTMRSLRFTYQMLMSMLSISGDTMTYNLQPQPQEAETFVHFHCPVSHYYSVVHVNSIIIKVRDELINHYIFDLHTTEVKILSRVHGQTQLEQAYQIDEAFCSM